MPLHAHKPNSLKFGITIYSRNFTIKQFNVSEVVIMQKKQNAVCICALYSLPRLHYKTNCIFNIAFEWHYNTLNLNLTRSRFSRFAHSALVRPNKTTPDTKELFSCFLLRKQSIICTCYTCVWSLHTLHHITKSRKENGQSNAQMQRSL